MNLKNPFPLRVRVLFMDAWECWICGENGTRTGGLELHHIWGRVSSSALNAAPLCHVCHEKVLHTRSTHWYLLKKTIRFLARASYIWLDEDIEFMHSIKGDLNGFEMV